MAIDIPQRIITIRDLAMEYFALAKGALIEKHDEILRIIDVEGGKHENHPHKGFRIYISRRSVKHFVEERRAELFKSHASADALTKICSAIEQIPEVIINFDKYEYEVYPEKYFYTKHYPGGPSIRILCERGIDGLYICSMHFKKQQKDK